MNFKQFHNAMRILFNIDADEFLHAAYGRDTKPAEDSKEWRDWTFFRDHPHEWFLRAPTAKAEAVYAIIENRDPPIVASSTGGRDVFVHTTPDIAKCRDGEDHDFTGWRDLPDRNGGEMVCSKCGVGAMAWSLRVGQ